LNLDLLFRCRLIVGRYREMDISRWWKTSVLKAGSQNVSEQITVCGSIMSTLQDMKDMMNFIVTSGITTEIGRVLPMEQAEEGIRAMWEGRMSGKTVFTR
jgi:D-arabinose 1-dehydrogenase-like Zn-dependent alcohol dehydrogenase